MNTDTTGKGMIAVACILGMVGLTLLFSEVEEHQRNPNQSPETLKKDGGVEVNLQRNRYGHYVTSGFINNQQVEFLLDTGATDVVIPEAVAERLGLEKGRPARAMTANGPVTVYQTRLDQLTIGGIRLTNIKANINPAMSPPGILLGMSALKQIEFKQSGDSLTLRHSSS